MINSELGKIVGAIIILGLIGSPTLLHANAIGTADKFKKQEFKLAPGNKGKSKVTIDFGRKFANDPNLKKLGKVDFKAKKKPGKGKKKPAAVFNFGEPDLNKAEVRYELVSLSLTSVNRVPLDPFLDPKDRGLGLFADDHIFFDVAGALKPKKAPIKITSKDKKKGKLKFSKLKDVKVSTPKQAGGKAGLKMKSSDVPFSTRGGIAGNGVGFTYASPIRITDPEFCLDAAGQDICLAPINPVPIPGALGLFGIGLAALFGANLFRRRTHGATTA